MADVRSLLRNERAQRRINHPNAVYTATGTLECSVCHIPLKSDQETWNKHLKSTQHAMRQERLRLNGGRPVASENTREVSMSKKRKADEVGDDSRKKTKPQVGVPGGFIGEVIEANASRTKRPLKERTIESKPSRAVVADGAPIEDKPNLSAKSSEPIPHSNGDNTAPIDEDEWAAFERDIATPPPEPSKPSVLTAEADVTAAPLTAVELAAQAREQANQQAREQREAGIEGEKEDAARALEEEFDEMEGLEERVARLKRMREELRARSAKEQEDKGINAEDKAKGSEPDEDDDSDEEVDIFRWGS